MQPSDRLALAKATSLENSLLRYCLCAHILEGLPSPARDRASIDPIFIRFRRESMKQPVRSLSICLSFTLLLLATSYARLVSRYNALVARAQMNSFAKTGLTLNANYTYGHTLDELSDTFSGSVNQQNLGYLDAFNPRVDYGNSYLDIRHRFTAAAIWDVPFAKGTHGYVRQVADGWTVAPLMIFETGTPFSIFDCTHAVTVCMYAVNANGGINRSAPSSLIPTGNPDNFVFTPLHHT